MPSSLAPIPEGVPIVDPTVGSISLFFRQRWQDLITGFQLAPTKANDATTAVGKTAALGTTTAFITLQAGRYRVSIYLRKTVAGGVTSSLTPTIGWIDKGTPVTAVGAALATDTATANASYTWLIDVDAVATITWEVAYASNAAATMTWNGAVTVEQMA